MRRIKKPSMLYKTPQDIRRHSFGVAKYVYLSILLLFVFIILNYIFYPAYLLNGDGFVLSERETVALEYDAKVKLLLVENGETVEAGQSLFLHDSLYYKSVFIKSTTDYADILMKYHKFLSDMNKLKAQITASKEYSQFVETNKKKLDQLYSGHVTDIDRVLNETTRLYESNKDLLTLKAEYESTIKAFDQLKDVVGLSSKTLSDMIEEFNDGLVKTPVSGVVGGLSITPGTVVLKGEPIMELYYGRRYISVLFEESFIEHKVGDPVIVYIPGKKFKVGRIVDVGAYSAKLPEEIKPKYRPPGRRSIATVLVEQDVLKDMDIMTVVEVFKPAGLDTFCMVFNCKDELIDEFRETIKARKDRDREILRHYTPYRVNLGVKEIEKMIENPEQAKPGNPQNAPQEKPAVKEEPAKDAPVKDEMINPLTPAPVHKDILMLEPPKEPAKDMMILKKDEMPMQEIIKVEPNSVNPEVKAQ